MSPFSLGCQVQSHLTRAAALLLMVMYLVTSLCHGHVLQEHRVVMYLLTSLCQGHVLQEHRIFMMPCPHAFLLHLHFSRLQAEICPVQKCFHSSSDTAQHLRLGA